METVQETTLASAAPALTAAERRLSILLRVLAAVFAASAVGYFVGPLIGSLRGAFRELPFAADSVVKVSMIGLCCVYAAGNIRARSGLVVIVIAAHVVSILAMVGLLLGADTGGTLHFGSQHVGMETALIGAIVLDGVIAALVLVFYLLARADAPAAPAADPGQLTGAEAWLRRALFGLLALFVAIGVVCELGPLLGTSKHFFVELPFVSNAVVGVSTFAMLCFYVARDLRARMALVGIVIVGQVLAVLVDVGYLVFRDTGYSLPLLGGHMKMTHALLALAALHAVIAGVFLLYRAAWTARLKPVFFTPLEYRTLMGVADAVLEGPERKVEPAEVAATVAGHFTSLYADRTWVYHVAMLGLQFHPLAFLKPPLSELDRETRVDHLKRHFQKLPQWPGSSFIRAMIRVGQQLTYVGYYNDPKVDESVGYKRFNVRAAEQGIKLPEPSRTGLVFESLPETDEVTLETDVCIVGSGAGGSILAYELAAAGREVLILERGEHVEPSEFVDDEVQMFARLYADGIMQQSQDFRFTVLQGNCVGGSTTVNNAVCFNPPEPVLARWNDPNQHDAGLDLDRLRRSVEHVREFLHVQQQPPGPLNPSGHLLGVGADKLGLTRGKLHVAPVDANIQGCLGCGYCNIGCRWGKKLSMIETTLPWAQQRFPGRLRLVSECKVERVRTLSGSPQRVNDVRARLRDGRRVTVKANSYVMAAGAVGSSYLLLQSGIGGGLPIGEQLCFNMGAPLTARFKDPQHAYAGLQISHYGLPLEMPGYAYETWFNPPVAQALNMPGWFGDHFQNMRDLDHLMAAGVIVGTEGNARVVKALTGGPDIQYTPTARDLNTLGRALKQLGKILFAAGAEQILVNTWNYDVIERPEDLGRLDAIVADPGNITLGTGHPQGGNAISRDPKRGVVGPDLRVHGYANLYVCDASVFPSSLTVNPQLTVMSVAHYAAAGIA